MVEYLILARVELMDAHTFLAIAWAVMAVPTYRIKAEVESRICGSLQVAQGARDELVAALEQRLASRGDRVVAVEVESGPRLDLCTRPNHPFFR